MEGSGSCVDFLAVDDGMMDIGAMQHKLDLLKAHSLPMTEHSSDKSSQDRLSQLDAKTGSDGMDWSLVAAAPVSSRLQAKSPAVPVMTTAEQQERAVRTSPRRVRLKLPLEPENSCESSKRNNSCTSDPAGRLEESRLQEALSANRCTAVQALKKVTGDTPEQRAKSARELAETLAAESQLKQKRAAQLIAVAHKMATEANRAAKRRRVTASQLPKFGASSHPLVGARVAVYWSDDSTFYKGVVVDEDEEQLLHKVVYDDDAEELLSLADERFRLLTPRATSAGCTSELIRELELLAAEELAPVPLAAAKRGAPPSPAVPAIQPSGEEAIGWRLALLCHADGQEYEAQVISYKPASGQHHLLYVDGEDEWVDLGQETLQWLKHCRAPLAAGPPSGVDPPSGQAAIGWRIAVYWKADQTFYAGTIQAFDPTMGRHHLVYNDGDEEHLHLAGEHVKWLGPPFRTPKASTTTRQPQGTARCGALSKAGSLEAPPEGLAGKRSPPRASAALRRPKSCNRLSRHGSRGSSHTGGRESVRAMLARVEADEAALMSEIEPAMIPMSLAPSSHHMFIPSSGASPLSDGLEGGGSSLPLTAGSTCVSPTQTSTLVPFKAADTSDEEPPQGWGADAKLLGWHLPSQAPPLRSCRSGGSQPIKMEPAAGSALDFKAELPTAPSPAPVLDPGLPTTFSADGSLLQAAAALPPQLGVAAGEDMAAGDLMDILMEVPGVDAAPTAWWQSM